MKKLLFYCIAGQPLFKKTPVERQSAQDIHIVGEISNFKLHKPSGHMYFTLKDDGSIIRCVFFLSRNKELTFVPAEGMRVVARGNISLYERSGYYQLYVEEIKPEGIGDLYFAFEMLKKLKRRAFLPQNTKSRCPVFQVYRSCNPSGSGRQRFLTFKRRFPHTRNSLPGGGAGQRGARPNY